MSSAIVRYGAPWIGRRALPLARMYRRRQRLYMAGRLASTLYRNRRGIKRFASKIIHSRKKKARFSLKRWGDNPNTSTCKAHETYRDANPTNGNTRTLYSSNLVSIPEGTNKHQRERRVVTIKGFRICGEVKNLHDHPIYLNVAVLVPRDSTVNINTVDFFRDTRTAERGRDFGTNMNGLEMHCTPINTDVYNILRHKRYRIINGTGGSNVVSLQNYNYKNIDWYIKVNRQIRWNTNAGLQSAANIPYLVWWTSVFGENESATSVTSAFIYNWKVITYFRDPCC